MTEALDLDFTRRLAGGAEIVARAKIDLRSTPIVVLFGPSGAGKTTVLRTIAGLDDPDRGRIVIDGESWVDSDRSVAVPPQRRRIGMMFQDYALFPHLSVEENIAFGPSAGREERLRRGRELARMLEIEHLLRRKPTKLSGGERQRVALARAVAPKPRLLLLDEPLSALDVPSRERLRLELRSLLRTLAIPTIIVTHDRTEAISLGDSIVVMVGGRVRQQGAPESVFAGPVDSEVARTVGVETIVPAEVDSIREGLATLHVGEVVIEAMHEDRIEGRVYACIRGEDVTLSRGRPAEGSARNRLAGRITSVVREGAMVRIVIDCGFRLVALITRQSCDEMALREGDEVTATIKALAIRLVPHAG